jgi:hypothetical protein
MASYMLLLHQSPDRPRPPGATPEFFAQVTREYMDWADGMRSAGKLKAGDKLTDDAGKVLRASGGKLTTTDGPYAESKEIVGGFFIITANDYAEACRLASSCPHVKYGSYIEVRQVQEL